MPKSLVTLVGAIAAAVALSAMPAAALELSFPTAPFQENDLVTVRITGESFSPAPPFRVVSITDGEIRVVNPVPCLITCGLFPIEPITLGLGRFAPGTYRVVVDDLARPGVAEATFEVLPAAFDLTGWRLTSFPERLTDDGLVTLTLARVVSQCETAAVRSFEVVDDAVLIDLDLGVVPICAPNKLRTLAFDLPLGALPAGEYRTFLTRTTGTLGPPDVQEIEGFAVSAAPDALELLGARFRVEATWRDFDRNVGVARPATFRTDRSGLLTFFDRDNWEVTVKVLDGCAVNDRVWVFLSAATNVEYTVTVVDTVTGASQVYFNPLGTDSPAVTDTDAFAACEEL